METAASDKRKAVEILRTASAALASVDDQERIIDSLKVIKKAAAGDEAAESAALRALAERLNTEEYLLDMWSEPCRPAAAAKVLETAAIRLKRELDVAETPDSLSEIVEERLERGVVYLPTSLLRSLYGLGAAVLEIRAGRRSAVDVEPAAMALMEAAAKWVEAATPRRGEDERACPVRPEIPF